MNTSHTGTCEFVRLCTNCAKWYYMPCHIKICFGTLQTKTWNLIFHISRLSVCFKIAGIFYTVLTILSFLKCLNRKNPHIFHTHVQHCSNCLFFAHYVLEFCFLLCRVNLFPMICFEFSRLVISLRPEKRACRILSTKLPISSRLLF